MENLVEHGGYHSITSWPPRCNDIQIGKDGALLAKRVSLPGQTRDLSILDASSHISTGRVSKLELSATTAVGLCLECEISDQPLPCIESRAGSRAVLI